MKKLEYDNGQRTIIENNFDARGEITEGKKTGKKEICARIEGKGQSNRMWWRSYGCI